MYLCACVPAAYTCVCARACVRGTWQEVESINFLIACGFIIFASNALIVAFLLARAQAVQEGVEASQYAAEEERKERESRRSGQPMEEGERTKRSGITAAHLGQGMHKKSVARRFCCALFCVSLPAVSLQLACLGSGFVQNTLSAQVRLCLDSNPS